MLREDRDISFRGGDKVSFFKGNDYVYEKVISITNLDKEIYFEFEGIYHHPQIYINDVLTYERPAYALQYKTPHQYKVDMGYQGSF